MLKQFMNYSVFAVAEKHLILMMDSRISDHRHIQGQIFIKKNNSITYRHVRVVATLCWCLAKLVALR